MAPVIEIRVPRSRHFGLITAAAVTVAAVAAAAPASPLAPVPTLIAAGKSKNVTGKDGRVPSTLAGDQYECTRTNPEMTIVDDSERGTVRLGTDPGHLKWDVKSSPQGSWEDAYISAGNNPDGYDSAQCNWLNSPGIDRRVYQSFGYHVIDGRLREVLYSLAHRWRYVVFAAPLATSKAVTVTDRNIGLFDLIRFAADHGLVKTGAELQGVNAGFEWYEDPAGGTQVEGYSLTGVK